MAKEFNFTIDNPKFEKREANAGEDAPAVSSDGVLVVCDGTGATGMNKHTIDGQTHTSAYLGSRVVSFATEKFLHENYDRIFDCIDDESEIKDIAFELGKAIRKELSDFVRKHDLKLSYHGKSYNLLPTTLAAAVYKVFDDCVKAVVFSAGDSRVLLWSEDNGLQQLSVDDIERGYDAFFDINNITNCITADDDFNINYAIYTSLPNKGLLFATSDGFTDALKPFEQEAWLMSVIYKESSVIDSVNGEFQSSLNRKINEFGFPQVDDVSLACVMFGFESDADLRSAACFDRIHNVSEKYVKPYKELQKQTREAHAKYHTVATADKSLVEQTKAVIRSKLLECASLLILDTDNSDPAIRDFLMTQPYIESAVSAFVSESTKNMSDLAKKTAEQEMEDAFVEAVKKFYIAVANCELNGYRLKFPVDIIDEDILSAVKQINRVTDTATKDIINCNSLLKKIQAEKEIILDDILTLDFNQMRADAYSLYTAFICLQEKAESIRAVKTITDDYFTFENPYFKKMYRESLSEHFGNLSFAIEQSKKQFTKMHDEFADAETAVDTLLECERKYDSAKVTKREFGISKNAAVRSFKNVIGEHLIELTDIIFNDELLFPLFTGESKESFVIRNDAGALEAEIKALIEKKKLLWFDYKPVYERFVHSKKGFVQISINRMGDNK